MKEINEIIHYLKMEIRYLKVYSNDEGLALSLAENQLDNANKVAAKLQGAIDLFKEIEEL
tara:strand:+ start:1060 stop:1239 length:180 start_codon:yes stop_codon:yes gene_type:complete